MKHDRCPMSGYDVQADGRCGKRASPIPNNARMVPQPDAHPDAQPRPRPRRRRWRILRLAFAVLLVFSLVVWRLSWSAPPVYTPAAGTTIRGTPLGSPDHDARVITLRDNEPSILHIKPAAPTDRGELLFFGALHTKDPAHPELAELRRVWKEFRPTVALVEGRMSFFVGTPTQGIRVFGEGAAVYSMAERDGIPLYTLEPPLEVEIAALEECGDRAQVAMFRFLSGYISARRGGAVSDFKVSRLLRKRARPLTDAFPDAAAFDAYYASQFPEAPNWRDIPEEAMWPGQSDTLLHRMATRSNRTRDAHFNRVMIDLVNRGERVLAIAGRSHTIIQEPVLLDSLAPASRAALSSRRPWEPPSE
jgi:hypothetical protein